LQSGFLAPLMLGMPRLKRNPGGPVPPAIVLKKQTEEAPERTGSFRETQ
jgi:hypothetical protein